MRGLAAGSADSIHNLPTALWLVWFQRGLEPGQSNRSFGHRNAIAAGKTEVRMNGLGHFKASTANEIKPQDSKWLVCA